MKIIFHQTHHTIADFDNIFKYLQEQIKKSEDALHVFPELFLTGYPLQDLCIQKPFFEKYEALLKKVEKLSSKISSDSTYLFGGLSYEYNKNKIPQSIKNVVFKLSNKGLEKVYTKQLLPNYDIFDEQKYFTPGNESCVLKINDKNIGVLICEDMWSSSFHKKDPVQLLAEHTNKQQLDFIVNMSASPYSLGKNTKRLQRAQEISSLFQCPFLYINKVGAEDEILFDGKSFICDGEKIHKQAKSFEQETLNFNLDDFQYSFKINETKNESNTWEDLFQSRIQKQKDKTHSLIPWSDDDCAEVIKALSLGFQDYAKKCGFSNFTIALSGGMDSALVLSIMRLALKEGQYLEAIYMPSIHSSPLSYDLSISLCENLGIPLKSLPIKFLHSTTKNLFGQSFSQPFDGLTDENIQSRLRGTLLYTRSNQINSMVVNTSNKSELAVGYSTQYGDSVGAISLLGDIFKSEVYRLAEYINQKHNGLIPKEIITRPPTAELRPDQRDTDSLPEYKVLDAILDGILSYRYTQKDLIKLGFEEAEVQKVFDLYKRTEYKRYQFCPILKISSKSFGFGYRVPISKSSTFYNK